MNAHHQLLGLYVPRDSPVHRAPAGAKIVGLTLATIVTLAAQSPWVSLACLVAYWLLLTVGSRLPARLALWPGWVVVLLAVGLGGYTWLTGSPGNAVMVTANLLCAVYGGRLLVLTTPVPAVVETIAAAGRPLRRLGINPEHPALAVGIMLRSIPHLVASFGDVGTAARARGLERNFFARITPVVVQAVAYAQATGDALAARGLGDD